MLTVDKIICILLMSCFDKELIGDQNCPKDCKCFSAPKGEFRGKNFRKNKFLGNELGENDNIIDRNLSNYEKLKAMEPINTLAVGTKSQVKFQTVSQSFPPLHINNFYLYGEQTQTQTQTQTPSDAIKMDVTIIPSIGLIDPKVLQVINLVNLDIRKIQWQWFSNHVALKAIYIENCDLPEINDKGFGLLTKLNIISVSIIKSKLSSIGEKTFNGWNQLKMISINGNPLKSLEGLNSTLPQLWYLNLKDNYIEELPDKFISYFPKLRVLKLDGNNLKVLTWTKLQPIASQLKEFSFRRNILCATEDVINIYQEFNKSDSTPPNKLPGLFVDSMMNIDCQEFNESGSLPPRDLCWHWFNGNYSINKMAPLWCINWSGAKL